MTDFTPPFGQDGERRLPTTTEQQLGFPCGPGSRELFNGLFWLHQGQFKNIADEAGVTPDQDGDLTLLKRAVLALIDAATGGNPDGYVLMTQARARLPVFPDVLHEDGHLGVLSPSTGNVRVPGGRDFLHRGIYLITTAQTDFATDPSKTYHLRWNPTEGFVLRDLASGTYNPTALAESNTAFDSTFDDMLVARVITNSSNAATVTNLLNKSQLWLDTVVEGVNWQSPGVNTARADFLAALNWARTPKTVGWSVKTAGVTSIASFFDADIGIYVYNNYPTAAPSIPKTRYSIAMTLMYDCATELAIQLTGAA